MDDLPYTLEDGTDFTLEAVGCPPIGILIMDLTRTSCRAIIDRFEGQAVYCGGEKTTTAFCDTHAALYYVPSRGGGGYQKVRDEGGEKSDRAPRPAKADSRDHTRDSKPDEDGAEPVVDDPEGELDEFEKVDEPVSFDDSIDPEWDK